jgi:hypothetical protein
MSSSFSLRGGYFYSIQKASPKQLFSLKFSGNNALFAEASNVVPGIAMFKEDVVKIGEGRLDLPPPPC